MFRSHTCHSTARHALTRLLMITAGAFGMALGGCASTTRTDLLAGRDPRSLPIYLARDTAAPPGSPDAPQRLAAGSNIRWSDLLTRASSVDVVIVGEQHDDALGHAVQCALIEDLAGRNPNPALSLEMLERDDQLLAQDYLDDLIDAQTFEKLTQSTNWGGEGKWSAWYQPIVDAAKSHKSVIVAANAPRRYVRLARLRGFDFMKDMAPERRDLFALPLLTDHGGYYTRFREVMSPPPADSPHPISPHGAAPAPPDDDSADQPDPIEEGFRSQLIWDATMADSIAKSLVAGNKPVVHLIGQFHSDFDGGTVQELRQRAPDATILVISMQRRDDLSLAKEDQDRAHIVIYTGAPQPGNHE